MRRRISFPLAEGTASRQAHADLPEGSFEREAGRNGFFGPATHFYHRHPPTGWTAIDGPLRPRAFDTARLSANGPSPWDAACLLSNRQLAIRLWVCERDMDHLVRNGDGDELLFVHDGAGTLCCDYGCLAYREGDYIVLPRGTMWRLEPESATRLLLVEATESAYALPEKGLLGEHALFDPAVLATPRMDENFRRQQAAPGTWDVRIKRRGAITVLRYPYNPLDALGWKGDLVPVKLNWRDIRPVTSHRYHLPPSAHTTFLAGGFVVCTFVPRPVESDPGALKLPFFHSNEDYDEVIFYHRGSFLSRDDIGPGMLTLHPCGLPHGPHPAAFEAARRHARTGTDEVAVMIDSRDPLEPSEAAMAAERPDYWKSWGAP